MAPPPPSGGGGGGAGTELPAIPSTPRDQQQQQQQQQGGGSFLMGSGQDGGSSSCARGGQNGGAATEPAGLDEHVRRRSKMGAEIREEYRLAKMQRQTAEEQVSMYENRLNLLQQRKAKALRALDGAARRAEQRTLIRQQAEEEAVERHRHREENRERFERSLREQRTMVETTRARAQMHRLSALRRNRDKVEMIQREKHGWREVRSEQIEYEAAATRRKKELVQASERGAKGNKEKVRADRIEVNRERMRREIGDNRRNVRDSVRLIGQYAEIERNLIDFVTRVEERQEMEELDLHDYICTAPSSRVDRIACALAGRRYSGGGLDGALTDRSSPPDFGRGYATVGGGSFFPNSTAMRTV